MFYFLSGSKLRMSIMQISDTTANFKVVCRWGGGGGLSKMICQVEFTVVILPGGH